MYAIQRERIVRGGLKKHVKKLVAFSMSLLVIFTYVGVDSVLAIKLGGKLINGPRNITYTVNGGAVPYTSNINNAAYNWMYTGYDNPIYMSPVSGTTGSTVDIYSYVDNNSTTTAYTTFFNSNNVSQSYIYDYWWNQILINDKYKYDYSLNHDAVMAHEFGHVLGLNDNNNNVNSIMCQTGAGRAVNKPQYVDSEEVVSIYGRY